MLSKTVIQTVIYGAIIGDCIGAFNEFGNKRKFDLFRIENKTDSFGHKYGNWTDDTSLSLIDLQNYAINGFHDHIWFMERAYEFVTKGDYTPYGVCFDVGIATRKAIDGDLERDPNKGNGNGALMRMYPVALSTFGLSEIEISYAVRKSVNMTHPHELNYQYCFAYVKVMHDIIRGMSKTDLAVKYKSFLDMPNDKQTGFVADSFIVALKMLVNHRSFTSGILEITSNGGDSDTIGSIYGSMASLYNFDIPKHFLNVEKKDFIDDIIDRFATKLENRKIILYFYPNPVIIALC